MPELTRMTRDPRVMGGKPCIRGMRVPDRMRAAMKEPYLEVTFRHGKAIAAYYYLPRETGQRSARTKRVEPGLVIDFAADGRPIGIEMTAPSKVSLNALNAVLEELGQPPASETDLAPVLAA